MSSDKQAFGGPDVFRVIDKRLPILPEAGLIFVIVGFALAMLAFPENPGEPGNLRISGLLMAGGLAGGVVLAVLRNPLTLFRCEHILVLSPIYWLLLDIIQGHYHLHDAPPESIRLAFVAIAIFGVCVWTMVFFTRVYHPAIVSRSAAIPLSAELIWRVILICFTLAFLRFAIPSNFNLFLMIEALGRNRWAAPWARGAFGGWDSFIDHLAYFGYLLPALTVLLAVRTRATHPRVVTAILLTAFLSMFFFQGGGRRIFGVMVGSALLTWILTRKSLRLSSLLWSIVGVVALLIAMEFMLQARSKGASEVIESGSFEVTKISVDDNFLRLSQTISIIPERHDYAYWQQVLFVAVRPVPRVFWPGKPTTPGFDLPEALGLSGFSLSMSALGEFYVSYGFVGIAIGSLFYGLIARFVTLLLAGDVFAARTFLYALGVMMLFVGMRSMLDLVLTSYALLAWLAISWMLAGWLKRQGLDPTEAFHREEAAPQMVEVPVRLRMPRHQAEAFGLLGHSSFHATSFPDTPSPDGDSNPGTVGLPPLRHV